MWTNFKEKHNITLNKEQEAAVVGENANTLLLAVPGSGKTTTLITKVRWLIENGVDPGQILTITFTRASARDMRVRFEKMFGVAPEGLKFQTIHSLCFGFLKSWGDRNSSPLPTIETNTSRLIIDLFEKYYGEYPTEFDVKDVQTAITYIKNMQLSKGEIKNYSCCGKSVGPLYSEYIKRMKAERKIDFDDLLVFTYQLFERNEKGILDEFSSRYKYILVDEAQDVSKIQHRIIELLAKKIGNIFMVGDEDQSIYGFRAAYPQALLSFSDTYKDACILTLDKNYRSKKEIIENANKVIANNVGRYDKEMIGTRRSGGHVSVPYLLSRKSQYMAIASTIKGEKAETAILYRNNDSAIPLAFHLLKKGVSFNFRDKDMSFFSTKLVRDLGDLLNFAREPKNPELFMKVYYKLGLKVKKSDAELAISKLKEKDPDLLEPLRRVKRGSPVIARETSRLRNELALIKEEKVINAFDRIITNIRPLQAGEKERAYILTALMDNRETLLDFLNKVEDLKTSLENKPFDAKAKIELSTIHGSKGREFSKVILIDVIDGLFPMYGEDVSLEEERRLFYVAITRAMDDLKVYEYAETSSTFLSEMGMARNGQKEARIVTEERRIPISSIEQKEENFRPYKVETESVRSDIKKIKLSPGTKVNHKTEGLGVVESVDEQYIVIKFKKNKTKKYSAQVCFEKGLLRLA